MTLHFLTTDSIAENFSSLYESDGVIAVADSDRYQAELERLKPQLHPETKLILFTSGSEGRAKFVQLSRASVEANTEAVIESLRFCEAREQFLFLPLYYSFGLLGQLLPAQRLGMTTHFLPNMMALRGEKLRGMLSAVGTQWDVLSKLLAPDGPYPDVTHVVSAGSRLSQATREALHRLFPRATIYNNYGQTECSPRILSLSSDQEGFYSNETGYPVRGLTGRLNEMGELEVRGPQVMLGYLGDEAGTRAKIVDGWLRTGDQATMAEDGRVTILGRADDLIKLGGERVSLLTYSQCATEIGLAREAIAVPFTDAGGIDRVALVLGGSGDPPPAEAEAIARIREALKSRSAIHVAPSAVLFQPELNKLPNGKIDRKVAKNIVLTQVKGASA
jgi:long-chain acyl-CoA synthetase